MPCERARGLVWAVSVGVVSVVGALAQSDSIDPGEVLPTELDLGECLVLAREHSPVIREARERIVEQEATARETRALRLPRADVGGFYVHEDQERLSDFGSGAGPDEESWQVAMEASLAVFTGGRLDAELKSQRELEGAFRAGSVAVENDVLLTVAETYYGALLARQRVRVQEEAIRLFELQFERARTRFESGAGPKFDLLQADVALANARPPLVRARNDYRIDVDELRRAIGLPYAPGRDASGVVLSLDWPEVQPPEDLEAATERALESRPELGDIEARIQSARYDVTASRRERAPDFEVYAGYQFTNDRFSGDRNDILQGWGVGLRGDWPLWTSGAIGSRVAQDHSRLIQLMLVERELRLAIEVEVRRSWFEVEQASDILETADRVIEQAQEAVRLAENRYSVGGLTQLDVLQSQLELTRALLEKAVAAHDFHVARAQLRRAQGLSPVEEAAPEER